MYSILDLYNVLCTDIHDISPRIGRSLPDSPVGKFGEFSDFADITPAEAAALALAKSIGKKCTDIVDDNAVDRCLLSFFEANASCGEWRLPAAVVPPRRVVEGRLTDNPLYEGIEAAWSRQMIELVKTCLRDTFSRPTPIELLRRFPDFEGESPWSWENIFLCGNIGPGAAISASGPSWYDKFYQSTLTYTSVDLLEAYIESLPLGSVREFAENQRNLSFGTMAVAGGKFGTVPKSFVTDRSIETQPSLNMWAQKGLAEIADAFLNQKYGFNLRFQPAINAELARRGSIHGNLATIDLKDASNRIPDGFIKWALEGTPFLRQMELCRTEKILMPWGGWLNLHLHSSMGNGYTFVLQTAVFLAVVEAMYIYRHRDMFKVPMPSVPRSVADLAWEHLQHESRWYTRVRDIPSLGILDPTNPQANWQKALEPLALPDWGVFGDDIICPTEFYEETVKVLGLINARVNFDKSFHTGLFRESCGADWFAGSLVRGVYCKSMKTTQDRVITLNRLIEWSAVTGLAVPNASRYLWKSVRKDAVTVPLHESHDAGLRVPLDWHKPLPKSQSVLATERHIQSRIHTYISYVPIVKKRTFEGAQTSIYGCGILLSMIRGETRSVLSVHPDTERVAGKGRWNIRKYSLTERQTDTTYESKWCWTTCWNNTLHPYYNAAQMDAALLRNLGSLPR